MIDGLTQHRFPRVPKARGKALGALSLAFLLVLAACGDDDAATTTAPQPAQPATAAPAPMTDAPAPAEEVTFVIAVPAVAGRLDIAEYGGNPSRHIREEFGGSLLRFDASDLPNAGCGSLIGDSSLSGDLVESWTVNADQTAIRMTLREAMSPSGNVVTSEDVKWNFDRMRDVSSQMNSLLYSLAGYDPENPVTIIDERTFELNVVPGKYLADTPQILTLWYATIVDSVEALKHATTDDPYADGWLSTNHASFGPWMLERFDPTVEVVFVPNPNYWDAANRGNVTRLVIRAVPDATTRVALLRGGDIDYAKALGLDDYSDLSSVAGVRVDQCANANRELLIFDNENPKFTDARVREALSLAIDRTSILQAAYRDLGQVATYGLHQAFGQDVFDTSGAKTYEYDPARAVALLEEAGATGLSFELLISPGRPGPQSEDAAIIIRDQMAAVGVDVSIQVIPGGADLASRYKEAAYEAIYYAHSPAIASPYYAAANYMLSTSPNNSYGWASAAFDDLVDQMRAGDDRAQAAQELSDLLLTEFPVLFLVDTAWLHAWNDQVSGYAHQQGGVVGVAYLTKTTS